jgi:cation diffusion facilitator CzcD-associated flavoprotein CzcO
MPAAAPAEDCNHHEVVIMGAGMSGLCMAMQLKAAGQHDFVVLEKSAGLGGTWWDNRYPGAQVDVPAPVYCFSFEPNTRWQRRFAAAPEIQAYMAHCAAKYGITPHLRLGTQVTGAEFDKVTGRWAIHTADGRTRSARYFVCSTGPLSHPRWPDIPGLTDFAGQRLHSAQWDASVALAGRRVAVIGTGSTAAQLVAPVAAQAARLHVFQRTANWVLPRMDRPYGALDHALARLPPYNAAVRALWTAVLEWGRRGFDDGTLARRGMQRTAAAHLQRQVADPALRQQLRPPYPLGCKRIIYANDYYPALAQPHVELVTTGIQRISAHGVQTVDGRQRDVDVLVCATGFDVQHALTVPITGRHGQTLAQAWADGPQAHLGLTVCGLIRLSPKISGAPDGQQDQNRSRPQGHPATPRAQGCDRHRAPGSEEQPGAWFAHAQQEEPRQAPQEGRLIPAGPDAGGCTRRHGPERAQAAPCCASPNCACR